MEVVRLPSETILPIFRPHEHYVSDRVRLVSASIFLNIFLTASHADADCSLLAHTPLAAWRDSSSTGVSLRGNDLFSTSERPEVGRGAESHTATLTRASRGGHVRAAVRGGGEAAWGSCVGEPGKLRGWGSSAGASWRALQGWSSTVLHVPRSRRATPPAK
jgi:hypothetical protein